MISYSTVMVKPSSFFNSYWLLFQEHKIAFIFLFKNKIMKRFFTLYMNWIMVTYNFLGCFHLWNDTSFLQVGTHYSVWRKIVSELALPLCSSLILAAFLLVREKENSGCLYVLNKRDRTIIFKQAPKSPRMNAWAVLSHLCVIRHVFKPFSQTEAQLAWIYFVQHLSD